MNASRKCSLVPRNNEGQVPSDLLRDCAVASTLLQKVMQEEPALSPEDAYRQVQTRMARVCIFPWDKMQLVHFD